MGMEARPALRLLGPFERYPFRGYRAYRFALSGADCILVESGMGIERATAAARALLSAFEPLYLISFGIAGSIEQGVQIGDVIVATQVLLFENGRLGKARPLGSLSESSCLAAEQALDASAARLYTGTAITTRGPQPTAPRLQGVSHPVLEMETMGIARAAGEHSVRLLSIRSISDTPEAPLPTAMEALMDAEFNLRFANIARICLRHPSKVLGLLRFSRNGMKAAENAAVAIAAILRDPLGAIPLPSHG